MVVGGRASALNDENILAANVFLNFDKCFSIRKGADGTASKFEIDARAYRTSQGRIGGSAKYFHDAIRVLWKFETARQSIQGVKCIFYVRARKGFLERRIVHLNFGSHPERIMLPAEIGIG